MLEKSERFDNHESVLAYNENISKINVDMNKSMYRNNKNEHFKSTYIIITIVWWLNI